MSLSRRSVSSVLCVPLSIVLAACQGMGMDSNGTAMPTMAPADGGMGLGGDARTTVLAEGTVDQLLAGPLVWVVAEPTADGELSHIHGGGFVLAREGQHTLTVADQDVTLPEGQALFLGHGTDHTHTGGAFWEIELANLPPEGPAAPPGTAIVFASDRLEGIPEPPVRLSFVVVELPPSGGQTAVHAHPGPEFIHVEDGPIEYQTALQETEQLTDGDGRTLASDTAVQKRNPGMEEARFLSWFLLDPDREFSHGASFE